jgi:hypothetical protein
MTRTLKHAAFIEPIKRAPLKPFEIKVIRDRCEGFPNQPNQLAVKEILKRLACGNRHRRFESFDGMFACAGHAAAKPITLGR